MSLKEVGGASMDSLFETALDSVDILSLAGQMFEKIEFLLEPNDSATSAYLYPEMLLQESANANKYYGSFQRYDRQFILEDTELTIKLLRWFEKSRIQRLLKVIIEEWVTSEQKGRSIDSETDFKKVAPANALFSWSSGDSYVQERRKQIEERKKKKAAAAVASNGGASTISTDSTALNNVVNVLDAKKPKQEPIISKLNKAIEIESNKFIHARIQKIKAHHNEQISKKIHERKRRDHEEHLHRLKLKEEEYEKKLLSASQKSGGFFGNIFGFNQASSPNPNTKKDEESVPTTTSNTLFTTTLSDTNITGSHDSLSSTKESVKTNNKRFSFLPTAWGKKQTEANESFEDDFNEFGNLEGTPVVEEEEEEAERKREEKEEEEEGEGDKDDDEDDDEEGEEGEETSVSENVQSTDKPTRSIGLGIASRMGSPIILSPTILTPIKKTFSESRASATPPPVEQVLTISNDGDDNDDEFLEFSSSVALPIGTSDPQNPNPNLNTNHSFIPLQSNAIHNDLLGLFSSPEPTFTPEGNPPAGTNQHVEDLLSL